MAWSFDRAVWVFASIGIALSGCTDAESGERLARSVGWGPAPAAALANLQKAYPGVPVSWSPVVHESGVGDYHAIWSEIGQIRAYVDGGDRVRALSISADDPSDYAAAFRQASRFVSAAAPAAPQSDREATARAIGSLLVGDTKTAAVTMDGLEFKVSVGLMHYSLRAKPAH